MIDSITVINSSLIEFLTVGVEKPIYTKLMWSTDLLNKQPQRLE